MTLIEAGILVLIVILVFLQDWRAMLVPATTVPVTIIGAFAAMAALGFIDQPARPCSPSSWPSASWSTTRSSSSRASSRHIEEGMPGREAAIKAMDELLGPVIGITLVLMAVFLPAAFLPGSDRPALPPVRPRHRRDRAHQRHQRDDAQADAMRASGCGRQSRLSSATSSTAASTRSMTASERGYARLDRRHGHAHALPDGRSSRWLWSASRSGGLTRVPTAFLPTEDQGYVIVGTQLPDGASKERTDAVLAQIQRSPSEIPGVEHVVTISGVSILDNRASLANAGVAFVVLKDWDARLKEQGQDLLSILRAPQRRLQVDPRSLLLRVPAAADPGHRQRRRLHDAGRNQRTAISTMPCCRALADTVVAGRQRAILAAAAQRRPFAPARRRSSSMSTGSRRRRSASPSARSSPRCPTMSARTMSTQFNKFGHIFQVYTQADAEYRAQRRGHPQSQGQGRRRNDDADRHGRRGQPGARAAADQPLQSLSVGDRSSASPAPGFSSGQALDIMEQIAASALPTGTGFDWTAMSYQEKQVGNQTYYIFGFAILLVYLVLAGQYESWILPLAVILAVPLALLGTVAGARSSQAAPPTTSTPRSASSCSSRSAARTRS